MGDKIWDEPSAERTRLSDEAAYAVSDERDMEALADLRSLVLSDVDDAVSYCAGRLYWRTSQGLPRPPPGDEFLPILRRLAILAEVGLPLHHPEKIHIYVDLARLVASEVTECTEEFEL